MNTYALQPLETNADQALDPMVIAAWLDGRATAEESAQVEAWMAADPEAMDQMLQLQLMASQPKAVTVDAELVQELKDITAPAGTSHPVLFRFEEMGRWAAGIAAVLVLGVLGFYLGGQTVSSPSTPGTAGTVATVETAQVKLSDLVNELSDMDTTDPVINLNDIKTQGAFLDHSEALEDIAFVLMGTELDLEQDDDALMVMAMLDDGDAWMEVLQ